MLAIQTILRLCQVATILGLFGRSPKTRKNYSNRTCLDRIESELKPMPMYARSILPALFTVLLISSFSAANAQSAEPIFQEKQCMREGWQREVMQVAGLQRYVLWKAPAAVWPKGAIIVLHGGGGEYFQWCVANARLVRPQVAFTKLAIEQGFAVFLLNSTDRITDNEGRSCGKIWDDEVRDRPNLDLPYIEAVIRKTIPSHRPPSSNRSIFLTGLSSGGYMTVRAATHFDNLITAFAPVSSGDPYGWHRICDASLNKRENVHGAGYDNETGKQIIERNSCQSSAYPNEKPWDTSGTSSRPPYRVFRHDKDGINDRSCAMKVSKQLSAHGYPGEEDFVLNGWFRTISHHFWQEDYNQPILDFFAKHLEQK